MLSETYQRHENALSLADFIEVDYKEHRAYALALIARGLARDGRTEKATFLIEKVLRLQRSYTNFQHVQGALAETLVICGLPDRAKPLFENALSFEYVSFIPKPFSELLSMAFQHLPLCVRIKWDTNHR